MKPHFLYGDAISLNNFVVVAEDMEERISAFQGGVAFVYLNRNGGHYTEMGGQAVEMYPGKYGKELPAVKTQ